MEIKRAIEILESGIKMPDVAHTSDELDTSLKLACKCLELYTCNGSVGAELALQYDKIDSLTAEIEAMKDQWNMYGGDVGITEIIKGIEAMKSENERLKEILSSCLVNGSTMCEFCKADCVSAGSDSGDYIFQCGCFKWRGLEE